jgi:dienelactone hydrolase
MPIQITSRSDQTAAKLLIQCLILIYSFATPIARADTVQDCHVGSYRFDNGRVIDIGDEGNSTLRWRAFTGETGQVTKQSDGSWLSTYGWTGRSDGKSVSFSDCDKGKITFGKESGQRIPFDVSNTTFQSGGVKLVGRLIMPQGKGKVPVVVLIHGSEQSSGIDTLFLQRIFPTQGIAAFVYDKRGTGRSDGAYTQDYNLLASDAVNAMNEARRLAGVRLERIGYWGGSQGGWVVPLAVNKVPVDFAIIGYGLAVNVIDEDQESVALDMHFHHHSAADTAKALELARAGEHVVATHGTDGYTQFDTLRQKFKSEPWYKDVHGDYLFMILPLDQKQIIETIKPFAATPFNYDPMPVLRASTTAQLWILGGNDLDAPSGETSRRIESLIAEGKDYTLAVYPGAEHGITLYELDAKGERIATRYAAGYFAMMRDFIRNGAIGGNYDNAEIIRSKIR